MTSLSSETLIENFKISFEDYNLDLLQKSKHWQKYYNYKYKKFEDEQYLQNFRKHLSEGLDDARHVDLKNVSKTIEEIGEDLVLKNLSKKNIGESEYAYRLFNYYIDMNELVHISWFKDLNSKIKESKIKNVIEIGGGFGSLARIILNNYNCKYILIDLPEANLLSSYFLTHNFPNKKIYLYKNYKKHKILSANEFFENDIFILPPWFHLDQNIKIDLFINTRSMMEMNFNVIKKYFSLIHQSISEDGYFLNINRYSKETVGHKINLWEYPYDDSWKVLLSKKSFKQNHIHLLLTQREKNEKNKNIVNELKIIKKIGLPYSEIKNKGKKLIFITSIIKKILILFIGKKTLNYVGQKFINLK